MTKLPQKKRKRKPEKSRPFCVHSPHDAESLQSVCEVCDEEIYYDSESDTWLSAEEEEE